MRRLVVHLADVLYDELVMAAADLGLDEEDTRRLQPEEFASQCVESVLASRRLEKQSFHHSL